VIIDLSDLLATQKIVHPTRLSSASFRDDRMCLGLKGYPWWRAGADWNEEGDAVLTFTGVSSGNAGLRTLLDTEDDEFLEDFEIVPTAQLSWAQPDQCSIYCSSAVPEPIRIYEVVERYIVDTGCRRPISDLLHGAAELSRYLTFTASPPFLLVSGPQKLSEPVIDELNRQGVVHTVHGTRGHPEALWFVSFADVWFFCDGATAEYETAPAPD